MRARPSEVKEHAQLLAVAVGCGFSLQNLSSTSHKTTQELVYEIQFSLLLNEQKITNRFNRFSYEKER